MPGAPAVSSWDSNDAYLMQTRRIAETKALDALDRAWSELFRTGRVLVFREGRAGWTFLPPHHWRADLVPFPCRTLKALRAEFEFLRHREWTRARREWAERRRRGTPSAHDALMFYPPEILSLPGPAVDKELLESPDTEVQADGFAFLLSRDLPGEFLETHPGCGGSEGNGPKSPRSRGGRKPLKEDMELVAELSRRMDRGEFSNPYRAVEEAYFEAPHRFAGNGTEESKKRRLRGKLTEHRKELGKPVSS